MGSNGKLRANENYAWDKKIIEYLDASKQVKQRKFDGSGRGI